MGKLTFINELLTIIKDDSIWFCDNKEKRIRVGHKMDEPELLIAAYGLDDWKNPNYSGRDDTKICRPNIPEFTRGLLRKTYNESDEVA